MAVEETSLRDRMIGIQDALAALYPARIVTRNLKDFDFRTPAELDAGIYTIVSKGEQGYKNYNGREAADGKHGILLVGQFKVAEAAEPELIEDQEFLMIVEIKAFLRALPGELCCLVMNGFQQSMQTSHPYGFIACDLEIGE